VALGFSCLSHHAVYRQRASRVMRLVQSFRSREDPAGWRPFIQVAGHAFAGGRGKEEYRTVVSYEEAPTSDGDLVTARWVTAELDYSVHLWSASLHSDWSESDHVVGRCSLLVRRVWRWLVSAAKRFE
jgi:hypothetical protein